MSTNNLNNSMVTATKWSTITELSAKLITPITNMLLARILAPEAFGVVSTITMIISFVDMFTDAGFQKYLIQYEFENEKERYNSITVAFWTNLAISLLLWGLIILNSDYIAYIVGNPGLGNVISVSCIQLPITAFSSIQMAIYKRDFDFKTLFLVRIVGIFIPILVTIPLALLGWSYWSLILGAIAGTLCNAIILTIKSQWKINFYYNFTLLRKMLSFSLWSLAEALSIWLSSWIDSFIIGNSLTTREVGIYKTSLNVVNSLMAIIAGSTTPILFSALSRLQENPKKFNEVYYNMQKMVAYILFPMGLGILLYSEFITSILLGDKWSEASSIIGIWSVVNIIKIIYGNYCSEYYRAKGMPKLSFWVQVLFLIFFIPLCIYSSKYGFMALVYAGTIGRLIIVIIHNLVMKMRFKLSFTVAFKNVFVPFFSSILMFIIGYILKFLNGGLVWDIVVIFICCLIYLGCIFIFGKKDLIRLFSIIKYRKIDFEYR